MSQSAANPTASTQGNGGVAPSHDVAASTEQQQQTNTINATPKFTRSGSLAAASRPAVGAMASGAYRAEDANESQENDTKVDGSTHRGRESLEDSIGELGGGGERRGRRQGSQDGEGASSERSESLVRKLGRLGLGLRRNSSGGDSKADESRGREHPTSATTAQHIIASGRGGAGNIIRSPSRGRDGSAMSKEEHAAISAAHAPHIVHAGRGGAGNVRSPSRDPQERAKVKEAELEENRLQQEKVRSDSQHPHTTGRGGAGNLTRDSSEDRGRGREGGSSTVKDVLRSLSRSRSRDARASGESPNRSQSRTRGSQLPQVDEAAVTNGSA